MKKILLKKIALTVVTCAAVASPMLTAVPVQAKDQSPIVLSITMNGSSARTKHRGKSQIQYRKAGSKKWKKWKSWNGLSPGIYYTRGRTSTKGKWTVKMTVKIPKKKK